MSGGKTVGIPEDESFLVNFWFPFLILACEIHFDNTPVPVENVLGKVGGGFKVNVLFQSVCISLICYTLTKALGLA